MTEVLKLTLTADRSLAYHRGGSFRYLRCDVLTPVDERPHDTSQQRLNLGLVLDASGSMEGVRLEAACETAREIAQQMTPHDRLSLVSFSSDVQVHLSGLAMTAENRLNVEAVLHGMRTRDMTNLAGGWFQGASEVAAGIREDVSEQHHLLLLSDGQANQGMLDPEELARHAANLQDRGVTTSTVGIGDGYESRFLQVLAEAGGGRMHDAERPEEIAKVVLGEFGELRRTLCQDVRVTLSGPDNTRVDLLTPYRLEAQGGDLVAILGSLPGSAERSLIWRCRLPQGAPGTEIPLTARCSWRDPETGASHESEATTVCLRLASGAENSAQERDLSASREAAQQWYSWIMKEAMRLNREGDWREAVSLVEKQLRHFSRYCEGLPDTEKWIEELERLRRRVERPMRERSRKEIEIRNLKMSRKEQDYRVRLEQEDGEFLD